MALTNGRRKQFEEPERIVKDIDPEAEGFALDSGSDDNDNEQVGEGTGTEHYEAVGKSRLREKDAISLGPQYRGSKVSRAALEEESEEEDDEEDDDEDSEEYADPNLVDLEADEAAASDSEIDSDNALCESDEERLKSFVFRGSSKPRTAGKKQSQSSKRATAADFMSGSSDKDEDEDEDEDEDLGSDSDMSDEDDMDDGLDALVDGGLDSEEEGSEEEDDEESDVAEEDESDSQSEDSDAADEKAAPKLAAPGPNARLDVEKGIAIQKQRKTYDELLNLRIRLQKALVAANTFPTLESGADSEEASQPYEAAEEAAINLLNTISHLRDHFGRPSSKAGSKRKRELVDMAMSSEELWEHLQADEPAYVRIRQDRLEKWSKKVQSATVTTTTNRLGSRNKTLIEALDEQLGDPTSRLVKRTRVARSCAPVQAAQRVTDDERIFDDADFYQQLLKELVEQRTVDTAGDQISAVPSVMLTAATSGAKSRKNVDRKASKGRKMRFTVHEKLQNFMAPEDRRGWEQAAVDRLFGTLFGQRMEMDEGERSEDEDMKMLKAQADGLRLFK